MALAATTSPARVLCHADLHAGNLLVTPAGDWHVVDWDAPIWAPPERDLTLIYGPGFSDRPADVDHFRRGYGSVEVHWPTLLYYSLDRLLDDINEFGQRILFDATLSDEGRADELHWLRVILAPGGGLDTYRTLSRRS